MKALILAASAAAVAATLPASASVVSLGNSLARSCYEAADARRAGPEEITVCTRALTETAMSYEDQFATHVNRGILRMLRNDHKRAEADFDKAVAMNPRHPEPWLNMGVMWYNRGDSARALAHFSRAIQLGTSAPEVAYYGRGLANEETGNIRAAYADLSRAASLKPGWNEPARELQRYQVRER